MPNPSPCIDSRAVNVRIDKLKLGQDQDSAAYIDFPLRFYKTSAMLPIEENRETMSRIDLPQGTLDLLILRTLSLEPQHGWGISERVQQVSSEVLRIQQGSLYPALHRLERRGLIRARWGTSENNRRARYYELTRAGRKQLEAETGLWKQLTVAVNQVLGEA